MTNSPKIVHTTQAVFVKHDDKYISLFEKQKIFELLDIFPDLIVDLLNELTVKYLEVATDVGKEFHETGVTNTKLLQMYVKAMTDYSDVVNTDYTKLKIERTKQTKKVVSS